MVKSMTAYSRASKSSRFGRFVVELHSVNRKMLDISINLPKDLMRFDIDIRKQIGKAIERGQISAKITLQAEGMSQNMMAAYLHQLKALKQNWDQLASTLGFDPAQSIDLSFLLSQVQLTTVREESEDEEEIRHLLKELVEHVLLDLIEMKHAEGKSLADDMRKRLTLIEEQLKIVEERREEPLKKYRKRIEEKLAELPTLQDEMQERVQREVALLAEKMDVTEELVRLSTHFQQFRKHLLEKDKAIGRTLDFLIQEMHREINTLGSKSVDCAISAHVVAIKAELEKIREQVQNIE